MNARSRPWKAANDDQRYSPEEQRPPWPLVPEYIAARMLLAADTAARLSHGRTPREARAIAEMIRTDTGQRAARERILRMLRAVSTVRSTQAATPQGVCSCRG